VERGIALGVAGCKGGIETGSATDSTLNSPTKSTPQRPFPREEKLEIEQHLAGFCAREKREVEELDKLGRL
jgi:hypothetical protein